MLKLAPALAKTVLIGVISWQIDIRQALYSGAV